MGAPIATDYFAVLQRAREFGRECGASGVPAGQNPYAEPSGDLFAGIDEGRLRAALIAQWAAGWDEGVGAPQC
jgi:hypothetical protein